MYALWIAGAWTLLLWIGLAIQSRDAQLFLKIGHDNKHTLLLVFGGKREI